METSDFVSDPGYASELSNSLYQLQQSGHLIDTFIKTKTGGINAHKIVLFANGGPFLQEQISRTVSLDTTMCNIDLSHVLHEDVLALITYLYTGKLKISCIESDSCLKLFQFLEIDLEKLKGNTTTAVMEKGVSIESECEDKDKSGDKDDQMDSNKLKDSPEKSDSGDSENEPFEIEISNMQEGEVEERSDFVGQVQIFDETTGELVKLEDVKIKPPAVRGKKKRLASAKKRKKEPVPLAEKRKRKAVPTIEETKKIQVESANKRKSPRTKKKETVNSVEDQQNKTLESSPSSSEINKVLLEEGTICSECSLDVRECVCEFSPSMDTMTCMRCHIRYTTKEDFIKHREEKHSLRCGMCDFKITRGSNLVSHMLEKHGISSNQLETGYTVKQEKTTDKQKGDNDEIPVSTETNNTLVTMETTTNEKLPIRHDRRYRQYSHIDLSNAYNAVNVDGLSVYSASRIYGVPEQTLRDRVKGLIDIDCVTTGRAPVLSIEEEEKLVNHIAAMAKLGYSYTRQELTDIASDYAVQLQKRSVNNPLTSHWFQSFRNRWPKIKDVQTGTLESESARCATIIHVENCFEKLDEILSKYGLKKNPHLIFNINESGFIPNKKPPFVMTSAEFDIKQQTGTPPKSKIVTVIGAGSASGVAIPPYFVFPGAKMMPSLLKNGVSGTVSKTGWSNIDTFRQYMKTHFIKYIPNREPDQYALILLDGHSSHIAVDVMEWATENRILIFIVPINTLDILQPLDVSCFPPLYVYFNHLCLDSTKTDMCGLMCKAYSKAICTENLLSGFRKCGIYPFNKDANLSSLAPVTVSIDDIAHEEEVVSENKDSVESNKNVIDY